MSTPTDHAGAGFVHQPPKKKHTVRNVVLALIGVGVLGFAGCAALVGSAVDDVDDALQEEAKNDRPHPIGEGEAFTHDIWKAKPGWKIKVGGPLEMVRIRGLRVENVGDSADTAMLTFTLDRGKNVLASIDCSSPQAQPGQVVRMSCIGDDAPKGDWNTVTVRDVF